MNYDNNFQESKKKQRSRRIYLRPNEVSKMKFEQKREEEEKEKCKTSNNNTYYQKQQLAREKEETEITNKYLHNIMKNQNESRSNFVNKEEKRRRRKRKTSENREIILLIHRRIFEET